MMVGDVEGLSQVILQVPSESNITYFKEDRREVKQYKKHNPDLIILNMVSKSKCFDILSSISNDWDYRDIPVFIITNESVKIDSCVKDYLGSVEVFKTPYDLKKLRVKIDLHLSLSKLRNITRNVYRKLGEISNG